MIRDYENPLVSLNKALLLGPYYFLGGGVALGGWYLRFLWIFFLSASEENYSMGSDGHDQRQFGELRR